MSFHGIHLPRARSLSTLVEQWPLDVADIQTLLIEAETLADLPTGVHPQLDEIGSDGRVMASAVTGAVNELEAHELTVTNMLASSSFAFTGSDDDEPFWERLIPDEWADMLAERREQLDEAQEIIDRIENATAEGRSPNPGDHARLRELLDVFVTDPDMVDRVIGLIFEGLPLQVAITFDTQEELDIAFAQVSEAIDKGTHPDDVEGVPRDLFPPEYLEWHGINDQIEALRDDRDDVDGGWFGWGGDDNAVAEINAQISDLLLEREEITLPGPDGQRIELHGDGAANRFEAALAVATHLGPQSDESLGANFAQLLNSKIDEIELMIVGNTIADSPDAAFGFYRTLGPEGATFIPYELEKEGLLDEGIILYSSALASVSDRDLGFTGADLIVADSPPDDYNYGLGSPNYADPTPVEFLLVADGFDQDFLLDAVTASLELRAGQSAAFPQSLNPDTYLTEYYDPRSVALYAIASNGESAALVESLDDDGQLDLLLNPGPFGEFYADNPYLPEQPTPVHIALAQAGEDPEAAQIVIDYVHGNRDEIPTIDDIRIANGVSTLLAVASDGYLEAGPNQDDFFSAYEVVVLSGSGHDLALVGNSQTIEDTVRTELAAGNTDIDLEDEAAFIGRIESIRFEAYLNDSDLADQAAANYNTIVAGLGVGVGVAGVLVGTTLAVVALPVTATVLAITGVALGIASFFGPDGDNSEKFLFDEVQQITDRPNVIVQQLLIGALGSGVVETPSGSPVELIPVDTDDGSREFRLVNTQTGAVLYEGDLKDDQGNPIDFNEPPFSFLVVPTPDGDIPLPDLIDDLDEVGRDINNVILPVINEHDR